MAWKKVCTLKNQGGLGVKRIDHFKNACLAKVGWNVLTNKENWWAEIVKSKYLHSPIF